MAKKKQKFGRRFELLFGESRTKKKRTAAGGRKRGKREKVPGAAGAEGRGARMAAQQRLRVQIGIKGRARVISLPAVLTGPAVGPGELQSIPSAPPPALQRGTGAAPRENVRASQRWRAAPPTSGWKSVRRTPPPPPVAHPGGSCPPALRHRMRAPTSRAPLPAYPPQKSKRPQPRRATVWLEDDDIFRRFTRNRVRRGQGVRPECRL